VSQNINQFSKPNWGVKLALDVSDMTLSTDGKNYKEEVVFSPYLIAETYGNKLPVNFDINDSISVQPIVLNYKNYNLYIDKSTEAFGEVITHIPYDHLYFNILALLAAGPKVFTKCLQG